MTEGSIVENCRDIKVCIDRVDSRQYEEGIFHIMRVTASTYASSIVERLNHSLATLPPALGAIIPTFVDDVEQAFGKIKNNDPSAKAHSSLVKDNVNTIIEEVEKLEQLGLLSARDSSRDPSPRHKTSDKKVPELIVSIDQKDNNKKAKKIPKARSRKKAKGVKTIKAEGEKPHKESKSERAEKHNRNRTVNSSSSQKKNQIAKYISTKPSFYKTKLRKKTH